MRRAQYSCRGSCRSACRVDKILWRLEIERKYMERALALARLGEGFTSPNPMVGAVIVARGRIIGEGYHRRCGGPHAEVWAVRSVSDSETGIDLVYARLLPEDKLSRLQEIRQSHGAVMFVGDGINDAPVLAGADVGAAMGSGADAAIEAADVVFMASNMETVPESIIIAKSATRIAWQNIIFALAVKALVLVLGLAGHASMWMAVFADSGVAMLCVLNSIRILYRQKKAAAPQQS